MTTICFIGAGSVQFTRDLAADILSFSELGESHLRLHDVNEDRLVTAKGVINSVARQLDVHPLVGTYLDRREALDGADFVINTVEIGGHERIRTDFTVPESFGVRQTVGDTLGVGGIFRALRTFPFLRSLAQDISEVCPDALLLNYTNPMAMNIGFLSRITPTVNAYGLCHSVYWTVADLCELVGVPLDEVTWRSAGVNHQAWMLSMEWNGRDIYPLIDDKIRSDPGLLRRVRVDMYRRLGYYPTETSEHSSEYVSWYLPYAGEVERLRIPVNSKIRASQEGLAAFEETKAALAAGGDVHLEVTAAEYAPQIIHSVVTGTVRTIQVNTSNTGLITNLPVGSPVEVSATVDSNGVHPWYMGELPPQCAALNRNYLNAVELTIHAALAEDPRAVRHALMLDPNTAATLPVERIWEMCNAMVSAHGESLPPWARPTLQATP